MAMKLYVLGFLGLAVYTWVSGTHFNSFTSGVALFVLAVTALAMEKQSDRLDEARQKAIDETVRHRKTLEAMREQCGWTMVQVDALAERVNQPADEAKR